MVKKPIKHPHIKLDGREETFPLGYSAWGEKIKEGGLTSAVFKNKLNAVLSVEDLRVKFDNKWFFEIKLRIDCYSPVSRNLFKQLGVEIRSVFDEKRVIVSGDKNTIEKYKNKSKINQEFLKAIRDIQIIESNEKIGESIKNIWDKERKLKVEIDFIDNPTKSEIEQFKKQTKSFSDNISFGKFTASAIASLSKKELTEISAIPIIKKISRTSVWKGAFIAKGANIKCDLNFVATKEPSLRPKVCVIDTGISEKLGGLCEGCTGITKNLFDIDDHGTAVASLCMFNKEELASSNRLLADIGVISHKISDESINDEINFFDELINAIEKHKDKTKIFCFSWNCINYHDTSYEDRLKELDNYLQKNNILLLNSAGNMDLDILTHLFSSYPNYLLTNPVMTPSESKYTFSVGAVHRSSPRKVKLSSLGRLMLPMNAINKTEDKFTRIKPEVFSDGGFIEYSEDNAEIRKGVVSLDCNCLKNAFVGTSISAPQIARVATILQNKYKYKNIETLKAMIFLKCQDFQQRFNKGSEVEAYHGKSLESEEEVLDADDGFYFFFENTTKLRERIKKEKKDKVFGMCWEIPVVKEIECVEFVICHSNNNPFESIRNFSTKIISPIFKPGRKGALSKNWDGGYGTMGKKAPLTFGKYKYTRNTPEGMWKIKAYVDASGIPEEIHKKIRIRYGVAVKLKIKEEFLENKDEIYSKLLQLLRKSVEDESSVDPIVEGTFQEPAKATGTEA